MPSRLEPFALLLAGPVLAVVRPPWTPLVEDRLVVVVWAAACLAWLWLTTVGGVHAWATRTGRRRWRRLSGALLPSGVRRRVERLAVAGLLLAPVAACAPGAGETPAAPVLVLEETIPLVPATSTPTTGAGSGLSSAPAPTTARPWTTAPGPSPAAPSTSLTTTPSAAPAPHASTVAPAPAPTPAPTTAPPGTPPTSHPARSAPAAAPTTGAVDPAGPSGPSAAPPAPPAAADQPDPGPDPLFPPAVDADARVVHRGESLWSIAADHVAADLGRRASAAEVAPYWRRVVEANRATLRSGDPDLIHPGEVVHLPPLPS